ncbi:SDR family NAD(P)-dependent oxidoreductase [Halomicroarcula sp. GCM10025324]|uniref:SDR family NAD(P)-dependent oxidoreductase n=1 Tax=Haloarcula TaxID=2237 RepID=UPI0023E79D6C|nr:SDR family NAD(P)-dependent oxidoreductase [Halomicroarcula sp. ZS-22-S1]
MSLDGRTAIVTGASSGIGRGIADCLAAAGANVAVADVRRDPKQGQYFETDVTVPTDEMVAEAHGVESLFVETDVSEEDDVVSLIAAVLERFDRLDILVNNAGIQVPGTTQDLSLDQWQEVLGVNLTGAFATSKYAMPYLDDAPAGRIVNVSSVNAYFGGGGAPYAASKAALLNLTRELALEAAVAGTTVNTVLPGVVKTPMQDLNDESVQEREAEKTPLSRLGEPADVGHAVRFFCSDEAAWITGAQLLVDGGYCAGR